MSITGLLTGLSGLFWIATIGLVIFTSIQVARGKPLKKARNFILIAFIGAVVLTVLSAGLVFIEPQERGVVISAVAPKGYKEAALQPGLRWIIPFVERVVRYPVSRQTYTMSIAAFEGQIQGDDSITARTADGQEIFVDASVIYQINPAKVVDVHILWQDRYSSDLVRAQSRGIIRDAVSQFNVEQVISDKRFELVSYIDRELGAKFEENGLTLVDFVLRNITFSTEYAASVEQKQIAEQLAKQAVFVVEQKKQEAQQVIETAKGDSQAAVIAAKGRAEARLIEAQVEADALNLIQGAIANNPELLTYQYISKLAPNISTMLLPSESPFVFQLPETLP
jgi:regulator of protease activity HflC (stomatin/prohibitin superfamily)